MKKINATKLMGIILKTNKTVNKTNEQLEGICSKVETNTEAIAELENSVKTLKSNIKKGTKNNKTSKAANCILALLIFAGVLLTVSRFVPQVAELLYLTRISEYALYIIFIGYALFTLVMATCVNVKTPIRLLSIIISIIPMASYLILIAM